MRQSTPKTSKIADIPEAIFLNGMTRLYSSGSILVADSGAGVVYRVDTSTGKYTAVIDDPLMKPVATSEYSQLGINGVHIRDNALYFTSSIQGVLARVPISVNGSAEGPAVAIVNNTSTVMDDFTFDTAGNALVTTDIHNTLDKIITSGSRMGNVSVVVGNLNSAILAGATAAQFGRTLVDKDVLYVTTNGGLAVPVNGTYTEGGKVVVITGLA